MNKTIKILLLVGAIVIACFAVMFYVKTIVSPPQELKFKNQYVNNLRNEIAAFEKLNNENSCDSLYQVISHEIAYQLREEYLMSKERDVLLDDFASKYTPLFVRYSNEKFRSSVWYVSDHDFMRSRISELQGMSVSEGSTNVIQGNMLASLDEILSTISLYNDAWRLARRTSYSSLSNAKSTIVSARDYASTSPINNCSALVTALNTVSSKLESSHYRHLSGLVHNLYYWENYSRKNYEELANGVAERIKEYNNNARNVYGQISDVNALTRKASNYFERSVTYYNSSNNHN